LISRLFYLLIAGGLGGLLGWVVSEPFAPSTVIPSGVNELSPDWVKLHANWVFHETVFGLACGLFIGGLIGGASGWTQGSMRHIRNGLLLGGLCGLFGGAFGVRLASAAYSAIVDPLMKNGRGDLQDAPILLVARAFGWGLFGMLLGAGQAVATRSGRRVFQGALGGLVGGAIGGVAFEISAAVFAPIMQMAEPGRQEVGRYSRAVGMVCVGAGIGLFVGLAEMALRSAWIRVLQGRNEGKEYLVDARQTVIGRSEMADISLYGDTSVSPQEAVITRVGRDYVLSAAGPNANMLLNGYALPQPTPIRDGDMLRIGSFDLQFRMKAGQGVRAPVDVQRAGMQSMPVAQNVCPFCGEFKDQFGNCTCATATATPVVPIAAQPTAGPPTLVALDGPLAGSRFPVADGLAIGREALGGIALPYDGQASRKHAHIGLENGGAVLYDDGSTNGTYVNQQRISRQPLAAGDTVTIGATNFRVE